MNIKSPTTISQAVSAYQGRSPVKVGPQSDTKTRSSSSMMVELSAGSQALHNATNDIDVAKVQAIREALANGTLKINAEKIASSLIASTAELLD